MPYAADVVAQELAPLAVRIPARKHQKLALSAEPEETLYIVRAGLFFIRAALPNARQQILGLLYPGDIARTRAMPPLPGAEITAATDTGEVWRLRGPAARAHIDGSPALARAISDRLTEQTARLALHNAILSGLNGDERVAALFIELALRAGTPTPAGLAFDMLLSRTDIADYLALNADTVSRIVSRLRAKGLISMVGRNRVVCRDIDLLGAECPLAATLHRMHDPARTFRQPESTAASPLPQRS